MEDKKRKENIEKLQKDYPNVPAEVYDIEDSPEMAELYQDMFGE